MSGPNALNRRLTFTLCNRTIRFGYGLRHLVKVHHLTCEESLVQVHQMRRKATYTSRAQIEGVGCE
ncbi:MAG TPA: hypothetical protein VGV89_09570 [Thermoplasmata archaeon]|nr:hypothetical protein [Thermoplasmata archaeon]